MTIPALLNRRMIGRSPVETSALSLGSWHTYDRMDFSDAVDLLQYAVQNGITLFDVAAYGLPGAAPVHTDVLFSAMVRAAGIPRSDYQLSAKLWLEGFGDHGFRPQLERALLRAGVEYADLVILGDLRRTDLELRDLVLDLASLADAGLIRTWGVNNWSTENIRQLVEIAAISGVSGPQIAQLKYSVARRAIPDGAPFAELFAAGLSMQASDVLEGGILAGNLAPDREVGRDPGDIRERIRASVPAIAEAAGRLGVSPAQLCLAFTLTHPANVSTLFGASRLGQVTDALEAVDLVHRVGADELRSLVEPFWADNGIVDPAGP
ncbi:aldo/keto reductase [Subtercola sp. YIM 133946]|uniref:aldo/keto reductase n=1 Tax=Subtercola sp. YIM 133946 TaxID=3118909 RepID=UPI002F92AA2E